MKRMLTLMLGLGLAIGSVTATFAQEQKKEEGKKKKGKKKKDDTKKETR